MRLILLIGTLVLAGPSQAAWQSLEAIQQTAERFVLQSIQADNVKVQAGYLDPRLRLPACNGKLVAFTSPGNGNVANRTVGVRCGGDQHWKLYVPVRATRSGKVLVTRRALPRGAALGADEVEWQDYDLNRLPYGFIDEIAAIEGQVLKRAVTAGTVLLPNLLDQRRMVKRGQQVTLVSSAGGVQISMGGKSLMDGALNQRIRVENLTSGRIVEGIVRSAERIEVSNR